MFRSRRVYVENGRLHLNPLDHLQRYSPSPPPTTQDPTSEGKEEEGERQDLDMDAPPETVTGLEPQGEHVSSEKTQLPSFPSGIKDKCEAVHEWLNSLGPHLVRASPENEIIYRDVTLPGSDIVKAISYVVRGGTPPLAAGYILNLLQDAPPRVRGLVRRGLLAKSTIGSKRRRIQCSSEESQNKVSECEQVLPSTVEGEMQRPTLESGRHPIDQVVVKPSVNTLKPWYRLV